MVEKYWVEWHLTPCGWRSGTEKTDFGSVYTVEPPPSRVLTCRCDEEEDTGTNQTRDTVTVLWESPDKEKVDFLKRRFGDCPTKLSL